MGRMSIQIVASKISKKRKSEIVNAITKNKISINSNGKYDSNSLSLLFKEWHNHFPHIKQQLGCIGCRKAVSKFWDSVNKFWELES
jgi:hypothetical protein